MLYTKEQVLEVLEEFADYYEIRETNIYLNDLTEERGLDAEDTEEYYTDKLEGFIGIIKDKGSI